MTFPSLHYSKSEKLAYKIGSRIRITQKNIRLFGNNMEELQENLEVFLVD